MFPLSPALSAVDSLDGIEDLDAFLEARGALSHFPTPPSATSNCKVSYRYYESSACLEARCDRVDRQPCHDLDYYTSAFLLTQQASLDHASVSSEQVEIIRGILVRAALPLDTIAIALNVLTSFRATQNTMRSDLPLLGSLSSPDCVWLQPFDRTVVAALEVATSYTTDHPPRKSWWVRHVAENAWPLTALHRTIRIILASLDWRLHTLSTQDSIVSALALITTQAEIAVTPDASLPSHQHLRLLIKDLEASPGAEPTSALDIPSYHWEHGQITPDERCPSMHFGDTKFNLSESSPVATGQPIMARFLQLL